MKQFMACLCHNDLSVLIAEGEATVEELAEAWANLFYEYCDLVEATETTYRVKLAAEIETYKTRNTLAAGWVKILQVVYSPKMAEALKAAGFEGYDLDYSDPDQYYEDLFRITSEINLSRLEVKIKEAQLESILQQYADQENGPDEKYFHTIFFRINNYARREAVNEMSMVRDYCVALRDYVEYNKIKKAETKS